MLFIDKVDASLALKRASLLVGTSARADNSSLRILSSTMPRIKKIAIHVRLTQRKLHEVLREVIVANCLGACAPLLER